jgi:multidrug resistance protein, MATE family
LLYIVLYVGCNVNSQFSWSKIFSEFKSSFRLAVPLIASELVYGLSNFIGTSMVAHLSKEELAANALVWEIYLTVILFFIGVIVAVSIMAAQSHGAKDIKSIGVCFKQGLIMSIIFALPMMLCMWFSPIILIWSGQDPVVIKFAKPFFFSLIWTMLPLNFMVLISNFLTGISKVRMVMLMSILMVPIEIFFYYVFLYGKLGMPKFGLAGIGYALTVSYILVSIVFFCYLYFSKKFKIYTLFTQWWKINKNFLLELIRIGMPIGGMFCIEVALFAVVAIMMGKLGTTTLAAYQISYQYLMIALVVIFALNQCVTVRVGTEVGENNRGALKLAALVNMGIGIALMSLFSLFYLIFPKVAIGIDLDIHAPHLQPLINTTVTFLSIVAVLILAENLRIISVGALRGLKDTKFPMFVSIVGFWCTAFPCSYWLGFKLGFGGVGIWWGVIIGLLVTSIILMIRFNYLVKHVDLKSLVTKAG